MSNDKDLDEIWAARFWAKTRKGAFVVAMILGGILAFMMIDQVVDPRGETRSEETR